VKAFIELKMKQVGKGSKMPKKSTKQANPWLEKDPYYQMLKRDDAA